MSDDCGCCEGIGASPPTNDNPPGLASLALRVGTHASFLAAMMTRLSQLRATDSARSDVPPAFMPGGEPEAATALLDAWACVGDVLTFYSERTANEGYLRTATERRSLIELARLVGYEPRPGVAASAHLAFAMQPGFDGEIPAGTRTQSMPRPGQLAQTFETRGSLDAAAAWNAMRPRVRATGRYIRFESRPQEKDPTLLEATGRVEICLKGIGQQVNVGDVVLLRAAEPAPDDRGVPFRVDNTRPDTALDHTLVLLTPMDGPPPAGAPKPAPGKPRFKPGGLAPLLLGLRRPANTKSKKSRPGLKIVRPSTQKARLGDLLDLLGGRRTRARETMVRALHSVKVPPPLTAQVFRARAQLFGHNTPLRFIQLDIPTNNLDARFIHLHQLGFTEVDREIFNERALVSLSREHRIAADDDEFVLHLDGEFVAIRPGSEVLVVRRSPVNANNADSAPAYYSYQVRDVHSLARRAYGHAGRSTRITLVKAQVPWLFAEEPYIQNRRQALVYAQSEPLELLAMPIDDDVAGSVLAIEGSVPELAPGRLLIVAGERTDVPGVTALSGAELMEVAVCELAEHDDPPSDMPTLESIPEALRQFATDPSSAPYLRITLAEPLQHSYRRSTAVIHGNVAHATHGETRDEILGSGDAASANQTFTLHQGPQTWVSAATPTGIASTLEVRVGGVLWPERSLAVSLGPRDEIVVTRALDGITEIKGGDGRRGARFPTAVENITARYRVGLGLAGNVDAGLITTLLTRPLGLREVTNPMRTSGGADPDGADELRARTPVAARALDRLVSLRDHADFALNFAGVDKATAWPGAAVHGHPSVVVAIAGDEDNPIDPTSDLFRNLLAALHRHGDPAIHIDLEVAEAVPLALGARIRVDPRYTWATVEPAVREALHVHQGWSSRQLGEAARRSVVLALLQAVPGVRAVDIDMFGPLRPDAPSAPEDEHSLASMLGLLDAYTGLLERLGEVDKHPRWSFAARPQQLLYFARDQPDLVILSEMKP